MPVDRYTDVPVPAYLLGEGMATLMETRFVGPPRPDRPDIRSARSFLAHVIDVAGSADVMRLYLESRPADFAELVSAHRAELPELDLFAQL